MAKQPRVGVIENNGPNTLISFLRNACDGTVQLDLAVAFLTSSGVDTLLYSLKKIARRGSVRLLTGLYQGFTEPAALRKLLRAQSESKGRISVAISRDEHFHWKCYFLKRSNSADLVVGSSNLTSDGLERSGELNVVLSVPTQSKPFQDLTAVFQRHWASKATILSEAVLAKYEDWRKVTEVALQRLNVPMQKILGAKTRKKPKQEYFVPRYWRTSLNGDLDDETVTVLNDTTDWDRRYYAYFSTWSSSFRIGDRVVLFDLAEKVASLVEIKDTTETPKRTPDGVHFAAYNRIRRSKVRRLTRNRWKSLKADKLLERRGDVAFTRRLSQTNYERFVENLKRIAK